AADDRSLCQGRFRSALGDRTAVAGGFIMLTDHVERYVRLRQTLGFKFDDAAKQLRGFAAFATATGDTHVRVSTAVAWAAQASSPNARHIRLQNVRRAARFLHVEDPVHEVPPPNLFHSPKVRLLPYIYSREQVSQIVQAAGCLRPTYALRQKVYATLLGLIAATGLRISEALDLRMTDVLPDVILRIRHTKFWKNPSRTLAPHRCRSARCLPRYAPAVGRDGGSRLSLIAQPLNRFQHSKRHVPSGAAAREDHTDATGLAS